MNAHSRLALLDPELSHCGNAHDPGHLVADEASEEDGWSLVVVVVRSEEDGWSLVVVVVRSEAVDQTTPSPHPEAIGVLDLEAGSHASLVTSTDC